MKNGVKILTVENEVLCPPATTLPRGLAFAVDVVFVLIAILLVSIFAPAPIGGWQHYERTNLILSLGYWVGCHALFGRTLGKYLFGLRVVAAPSQLKSDILSVLIRETLGRTVTFALLPISIILFLFKQDGRSLHDFVGRSMVIDEGGGLVAPGLAVLAGPILLACSLGGVAYTAAYTPFLFNLLAKRMPALSYTTATGSLFKGLTLASVSIPKQDGTQGINLEKLTLSANLQESRAEHKFIFENILAQNVTVTAEAPVPQGDMIKDVTTAGKMPTITALNTKVPLKIKNLDLRNLIFQAPGKKPTYVDRFFVEDLMADAEGTSWKRLYVKAPTFTLNVGPVSIDPSGAITMKGSAEVLLNPSFNPRLKAPIKISGYAEINKNNLNSLRLVAANRAISFSIMDMTATLDLRNFSPQTYLKTALPISAINVKGRAPYGRLKEMIFSGHFLLQQSRGKITENRISFDGDSDLGVFHLDMNGFLSSALGRPAIVFRRKSGQPVSPKEYLAALYFGHPPPQLLPEQRQVTDRDATYFELGNPDLHLRAFRSFYKSKSKVTTRPRRRVKRIPTSLPEKRK